VSVFNMRFILVNLNNIIIHYYIKLIILVLFYNLNVLFRFEFLINKRWLRLLLVFQQVICKSISKIHSTLVNFDIKIFTLILDSLFNYILDCLFCCLIAIRYLLINCINLLFRWSFEEVFYDLVFL
jgi:hypothetical protein